MVIASKDFQDVSSDDSLAPFLSKSFSPIEYLNSTLPSWASDAQSSVISVSAPNVSSSSLAEITAQTQTIITQLNAQLTRLSASLTGIADDILRTGGRLAYEVELLGGDVGSLSDALAERLNGQIAQLAPGQPVQDEISISNVTLDEPSTDKAITRLHTLTLVRDRLEAVVKVFGEAMAWPIAPSEVISKTSFISVSGPDDGIDTDAREKQGKAFHEKLRAEVNELLSAGSDAGELAALRRLEALRSLAAVWKGTSEEKPRLKMIESLARMVEDSKLAGNTTGRSGYGLGAELPSRSGPTRK